MLRLQGTRPASYQTDLSPRGGASNAGCLVRLGSMHPRPATESRTGSHPRPLRVLVLQPDADPYGACRAFLRTLRAMPPGTVEATVVFPYDGDAIAEYEAAGCVTVIEPSLAVLRRSSSGVRGLLRLARNRRRSGHRLARVALERRCHLVHTNSATVVSGMAAARKAHIPHAWQLREAPRERGLRLWALRRLLSRGADVVIAVSKAAAELAPADAVVHVVYDGYNRPNTRPHHCSLAPGSFLVGMIGRISPTKAQHTAIEAVSLLRREGYDLTLVIAGTLYRDYVAYGQGLVEQAGPMTQHGHVSFLGWLDDPLPLLGQLDALVIATAQGEGFPAAVLEALSLGVPVVSAASGGVEELVVDGVTGLQGDPQAPVESLVRDLRRLIEDDDLRARLSTMGPRHAEQFTVEASATDMLAAWRSVVGSHVR